MASCNSQLQQPTTDGYTKRSWAKISWAKIAVSTELMPMPMILLIDADDIASG